MLLGNKFIKTTLLYRGSDHGWYYSNFHQRCDLKGPTIILYEIKDGDCIGGYTEAQWESADYPGRWKNDTSAMLFNLA